MGVGLRTILDLIPGSLSRATATVAVVLITCLSGAMLCAADRVPGTGRMTMSDFRTRGTGAVDGRDWELSGGEAVLQGRTVDLQHLLLTFTMADGSKIEITSPRCSFNRDSLIGRSDAPLHAEARGVVVDGVGYDVFVKEQTLHVRRRVRMKIRRKIRLSERIPFLSRPSKEALPPARDTSGPTGGALR